MKHEYHVLMTKLFLTIGTVLGVTTKTIQDVDLLLGVILKGVSIVSFVIVILLNLPKLIRKIKLYLKK